MYKVRRFSKTVESSCSYTTLFPSVIRRFWKTVVQTVVPPTHYDVGGEGHIQPLDALLVINYLNRESIGLQVAVSEPEIVQLAGNNLQWTGDFDEPGGHYLVEIASTPNCLGGIVSSVELPVGVHEFDMPAGLPLGDVYACVRYQHESGLTVPADNHGLEFTVGPAHRVFVTGYGMLISGTQQNISGEIGNIEGADFNCTEIAANAGFVEDWDFSSIVWKAVISDSNETAYDRLPIVGPLYNLKGDRLAVDKDDFFDDELENQILYDEALTTAGSRFFWHGTRPDGRAKSVNCIDWSPTGGEARTGSAETLNWMSAAGGNGDCDTSSNSLVCVGPAEPSVLFPL